ncbi:hypothetical protein PENTCL1PPCAC_2298 [Pristionchus entomophagus]|uniref:Actin maturation protease n=1 Tax=Pristionchus entomophagus TaxID=358040 RepID=A0AAV5SD50_9BILA|nr:hypothetical protein PENTCL1PPCAC_2298 [Pristionchus entomophagus]
MDHLSPLVQGRIEQARARFALTSGEDSFLPRAYIHLLSVDPISQNGPQCGIVALTMGLRYLTGQEITVSHLLKRAIDCGLTKQGEMFEATDLLSLSAHSSISSTLLIPLPSPTTVVQSIIDRSLLLIPYDCDRNHEPSLRKGMAAHWAIIVGVLVIKNESGELSTFPDDFQSIFSDLSPERLFVLAYHGKSKHLGVWSYSDLIASNLQMTQLGETRKEDDFIVKDPSLGGLRDQIVLITRCDKD